MARNRRKSGAGSRSPLSPTVPSPPVAQLQFSSELQEANSLAAAIRSEVQAAQQHVGDVLDEEPGHRRQFMLGFLARHGISQPAISAAKRSGAEGHDFLYAAAALHKVPGVSVECVKAALGACAQGKLIAPVAKALSEGASAEAARHFVSAAVARKGVSFGEEFVLAGVKAVSKFGAGREKPFASSVVRLHKLGFDDASVFHAASALHALKNESLPQRFNLVGRARELASTAGASSSELPFIAEAVSSAGERHVAAALAAGVRGGVLSKVACGLAARGSYHAASVKPFAAIIASSNYRHPAEVLRALDRGAASEHITPFLDARAVPPRKLVDYALLAQHSKMALSPVQAGRVLRLREDYPLVCCKVEDGDLARAVVDNEGASDAQFSSALAACAAARDSQNLSGVVSVTQLCGDSSRLLADVARVASQLGRLREGQLRDAALALKAVADSPFKGGKDDFGLVAEALRESSGKRVAWMALAHSMHPAMARVLKNFDAEQAPFALAALTHLARTGENLHPGKPFDNPNVAVTFSELSRRASSVAGLARELGVKGEDLTYLLVASLVFKIVDLRRLWQLGHRGKLMHYATHVWVEHGFREVAEGRGLLDSPKTVAFEVLVKKNLKGSKAVGAAVGLAGGSFDQFTVDALSRRLPNGVQARRVDAASAAVEGDAAVSTDLSDLNTVFSLLEPFRESVERAFRGHAEPVGK